ncbi:hypothetical protein [Sodalis-like endosymbiont of Proechinophthirus fluctus]|uniref:hypothetical protein n=1 Tax=Sodalis-like endosymbiont of Proechinophthirus fluctus TaxID=1462730 RepID=UPI00164FCE17|nr:hypothetical protein [Sodalis-like endosymbiont of Proechinophthirus fluctus]
MARACRVPIPGGAPWYAHPTIVSPNDVAIIGLGNARHCLGASYQRGDAGKDYRESE